MEEKYPYRYKSRIEHITRASTFSSVTDATLVDEYISSSQGINTISSDIATNFQHRQHINLEKPVDEKNNLYPGSPIICINDTPTSNNDEPQTYTKKSIYTPVQKPSPVTTKTSFFHIFRFASIFDFFLMALAIFFSLLRGLIIPLMTILLGNIFNSFTEQQLGTITNQIFIQQINVSVLEFSLLGVCSFFFTALMTALWSWTAERQGKRMKYVYFRSLLKMPIDYFEDPEITSGGLLTSVNKDTENVQTSISDDIGDVIQYTVTALSCLVLAFTKNAVLTLVILASMPLVFVTLAYTTAKANPLLSKEREIFMKAGNVLESSLSAIKTIKAFNGEAKEEKKHLDNLQEVNSVSSKLAWVYAIRVGMIQFIILSLFVQGFWFGSILVSEKKLAPGDVLSIFYASLLGASVLKEILPKLASMAKATDAVKHINILLEKVALIDLRALRGFTLTEIKGNIEFNDVSFSYPTRPDTYVLKNINLTIPAGKTTVLVGQSGSGKSTITQLIQRLYEPNEGIITLDERELRILNITWLRQQIGVVCQEPVLFDDTIYQNVAYGRPDYWNVSIDEVIAACKTACIHEFIEELPEGYQTRLGDKARKLSGGQRQRLAIARALIKNPAILILDEASSALDMTSDSMVQKALQNSRVGRTTIVVTHQLTHIAETDFVYVLHDGEVVEHGTPPELLKNSKGHYSKLVEESLTRPNPKRRTPQLDLINMKLKRSDTLPINKNKEQNSNYLAVENISTGSLLQRSVSMTAQMGWRTSQKAGWRQSFYEESLDHNVADVLNGTALAAISKRNENRMSYFGILSYYEQTDDEGIIEILTTATNDSTSEKPRIGFKKMIIDTMQNRTQYFIGLFASLVNGFIMPIFSFVLASLLNTYAIPDKLLLQQEAKMYALIVLGIAIMNGITAHAKYYLLERASEQWSIRLRHLGFGKVLRQPQSWFDAPDHAVGKVVTILVNDTDTAKNLIGRFIGNMTYGLVSLLGGMIWAFVIGWQLTLVGFGLVPVLLLASELQGYVLQKYEKKQKAANEEAANLFYQMVSSIRTVFSLAIERAMDEKFQEALNVPFKIGVRKAFVCGFTSGLLDSFSYFSKAITFWYGAQLVAQGTYDLKTMLQVWTLVIFCTTAASQMLATIPYFAKSKQAGKSVARLLSLSEEDTISGKKLDNMQGKIEFRNIHFSYPGRPDTKILNGLNLELKSGESVALVGRSGNGKSTVATLLQRFYDPNEGTILLDREPLNSIQLHWLRDQIGIVSQESILFDMTVRENITYGKEDATIEEVENAAKQVNMHEFIKTLPNGYETKLGSSGTQLSGGQKQRLSIARVLIKNPRILILDEATSALDASNEQVILETLNRVQKNRTTLVITHRLNNVKNMDKIGLVESGRITEIGSHRELMSLKKGYFKLVVSGNN
ncbi:P-loop containing nucleoside triphosphate hydrolase protein [Gigaspora margarita]|uniref:P-loop containing nucleoside triphosphate hydrolase protein n=1 Tax=Gigaspora margarita TaxID=4874 RepID=A0A8H3WZK1_GIGMA|nr:P-loop containing nucleoside triphosphate hydrolase protein [Gigaspora margarita]